MKSTRLATQNNTKQRTEDVVEFVLKNSDGLYARHEREYLERFIQNHIAYGTLMVTRDKNGIVSVVRWNWLSWTHAKILDLVIRPDMRRKAIMRTMLIQAIATFPHLKTITFQRKQAGRLKESTRLVDDFIRSYHGKG